MTSRPTLLRSVPFWILVIGSLASVGLGIWIAVSRLGALTTALSTQPATTADSIKVSVAVYGGQSLVVLGAALVGAGLIGLALALAVAAVGALVRRPDDAAAEVVEIDVDDAFAQTLAAEAEPVEAAEAQPVEAADTAPAAPAAPDAEEPVAPAAEEPTGADDARPAAEDAKSATN